MCPNGAYTHAGLIISVQAEKNLFSFAGIGLAQNEKKKF